MSYVFSHPQEEDMAEELHRKTHMHKREQKRMYDALVQSQVNVNWDAVKQISPGTIMQAVKSTSYDAQIDNGRNVLPVPTGTPPTKREMIMSHIEGYAPDIKPVPAPSSLSKKVMIVYPVLDGETERDIHTTCLEGSDYLQVMYDYLKNNMTSYSTMWASQEDIEGAVYVENSGT